MDLWTVTLLGGLVFSDMQEVACVVYETDRNIAALIQKFVRPRHGEFCLEHGLVKLRYRDTLYTAGAFVLTRKAQPKDAER